MPVEPHRRRLGAHWNRGALLLWQFMFKHGLRQSDIRDRLHGKSDKPLSDGAVNRWLYGERRPSRPLTTQMERLFGIEPASWDDEAVERRIPKPDREAA